MFGNIVFLLIFESHNQKRNKMDNVNKIDDLKNQLELLFLEMPQTFFQLEQRNKSAFLISREIEKLENPESYKNNIQHWENYSMNF